MFALLAYVGPETVVPVASILAAAGGFVLAGWRWIRHGFMRCLGNVSSKPASMHDGSTTEDSCASSST